MNKQQLVELLEELARKDLVDGAEQGDHPCTIAIKAINQSFDDIEYLVDILNGRQTKRAKRAVYLIKLRYNPDY